MMKVEIEIYRRGFPPTRALMRVSYVGTKPTNEMVESALSKVLKPRRFKIIAFDVPDFVGVTTHRLLVGRKPATSHKDSNGN